MTSEQRRQFLRNAALAASVATLPRWAWSAPPALQTNPFALGIASGDPAPDGVVLWTRLLLTEARRDICTLKDDIFGFGSCFA